MYKTIEAREGFWGVGGKDGMGENAWNGNLY